MLSSIINASGYVLWLSGRSLAEHLETRRRMWERAHQIRRDFQRILR